MVNRVILIGRLGKDPEVRHTASGTPVASFSLATNERWTDSDGQKKDRTEWHNIVAWSKLADICGQFLKKGKLIYVEGRLQTREWDDRDGNKRRTTEVIALNMQMLEPRTTSGIEGPGSSGKTSNDMEIGITDDDIPF
jgi:single-strand DNA-binding protein